jgi:hypothetical protein
MEVLQRVAGTLAKYGQRNLAREAAAVSLEVKASVRTADEVGRIILDQMGGPGRLKAMLGATMTLIPHGVMIKWPNPQRNRGNLVEITLQPSDTYEMTFYNAIRGSKKVVKKYDDVYFDQLIDLFEKQTGWYLKLA